MAVRCGFDVVVVGGGIAGSVLAGVLARSGVRVLVAEKEPRFRDRIRGESTYPWGVAEAARLGAGAVFEQAGAVELVGMRIYEAREPVQTGRWAATSLGGWNEAGFPHPRLQEAAFCWAQSMGAAVRRPMRVTGFSGGGVAAVTVTRDGRVEQLQARLVVGADGKMAQTRRWTGGHSAADPEHHRFGGVAVSGVRTDDRDTDNLAGIPGLGVNWFAQGAETTRLYLNMPYGPLRASRADRSFDALLAVAAEYMPDGALDGVRQEGPIGFFSNADTWATQIAGHDVVLIGDAAGSVDPTQGLGNTRSGAGAISPSLGNTTCGATSSIWTQARRPIVCAKGTRQRPRPTRHSAGSPSSRPAGPTAWSPTQAPARHISGRLPESRDRRPPPSPRSYPPNQLTRALIEPTRTTLYLIRTNARHRDQDEKRSLQGRPNRVV
jgi:2-polyprenyl-6-methoxyphenol hydroxylase-like FAD-dependent oxidoreductase